METPSLIPALTADEIRHKILEQFEQFKPTLQTYHEYAERVAALNEEYHAARFKEQFECIPVEELSLIGTLDSRETPKSLDVKLAQLKADRISPKKIIYDRVKGLYYLFI